MTSTRISNSITDCRCHSCVPGAWRSPNHLGHYDEDQCDNHGAQAQPGEGQRLEVEDDVGDVQPDEAEDAAAGPDHELAGVLEDGAGEGPRDPCREALG